MSLLRRRVLAAALLLFIAFAVVVPLLLTRDACLGETRCIWQTVLLAAAVMLAVVLLLLWLMLRTLEEDVGEMTAIAQRAAAGDRRARLLPRGRGPYSDFISAFNQLLDSQRSEVDTLSAEHSRFSTVLDHMADGVLITDRFGVVRLINPAACRILDRTAGEAIGRPASAVVRHHQLIEMLQRGRDEITEHVESIELGPDLFLQAVVTPFEEKGAIGYLVILQDLTQVRRLQTMRRDFISNLSHELRTPLASLRAVVETLQDGAINDPSAAARFLSRADEEVDTLTQMVEELLELSQIESGQVRLRLAPCVVDEIISMPVDRLRSQADAHELTIVVDLPNDLPEILVDVKRMQQVITNLLHNAIKFTPAGGRIEIVASLQKESAQTPEVVVEIRDTGIGIPKQELPRVFERFYKSDRARTRGQGGTGLGLAIARHIVQAHGGRIWARSREGKGSTFYISLPVA